VYKKPTQTNPIWTPVTTTTVTSTTKRQIVLPPWDIKAMALCNLESLQADLKFLNITFRQNGYSSGSTTFLSTKMTLTL